MNVFLFYFEISQLTVPLFRYLISALNQITHELLLHFTINSVWCVIERHRLHQCDTGNLSTTVELVGKFSQQSHHYSLFQLPLYKTGRAYGSIKSIVTVSVNTWCWDWIIYSLYPYCALCLTLNIQTHESIWEKEEEKERSVVRDRQTDRGDETGGRERRGDKWEDDNKEEEMRWREEVEYETYKQMKYSPLGISSGFSNCCKITRYELSSWWDTDDAPLTSEFPPFISTHLWRSH